MVFGESKLYKTLKGGISDSFKSILKFLTNKKDGYETSLVSTELFKEAYETDLYKKLKLILLPDARKDKYNLDHSFGLFVGFNYEINVGIRALDNPTAREQIREFVKKEVESCIEHINKKINQDNLKGYAFYIYVMPFSDLPNKRREIIKEVIS